MRRLDLNSVVAGRRDRQRDLVVAMIVARVIDPHSKLATARGLDDGANSLGDALCLQSADENDL